MQESTYEKVKMKLFFYQKKKKLWEFQLYWQQLRNLFFIETINARKTGSSLLLPVIKT